MACDSLEMSGSDTESDSLLDCVPDGSVRLAPTFKGPTVHLIWRPNSHKFDGRIIPLTEPVKVGRSVAKFKPTVRNAIFDCKVLSRNHALLWYEDGKFLIQDTQSSNGTFVNNERLSKGTEESPPREIFSGDILQFGVDVIENSKKVTHGCVIALARLFHPDGSEAKPAANAGQDSFSSLTYGQREALVQFVLDATQREVALRSKIKSLQGVIEKMMRAAEQSWEAMIDEERLLNKIESLETKLAAVGENKQSPEITKMIEAKETYEDLARDSLSTILQEKLVMQRKCDELQYLQKITYEQLSQLQESNAALRVQLSELADKCDSMTQEAESVLESYVSEKKELEAKNAQLQEEVTKQSEEIAAMTAELAVHKQDETKEAKPKTESPISEKGLTIEDAASEAEDKISLDSFQGETKSYKDEILRLEEKLKEVRAKVADTNAAEADVASRIELNVQLDMFKRENARLEAEVAEVAQAMAAIKAENDALKARLDRAPASSAVLGQTETAVTPSESRVLAATPAPAPESGEDAESAREMRRLQTELTNLKQSYARCIEDKIEMRKEFDELAKEYGGVARQLNTVCRTAVVPLVVLCVGMILMSQPFYSVFGSTKS